MAHLYRFGPEDILHNNMTTHALYDVTMFSGSAYINNARFQGSDVPSGSISLHEINVDRTAIGAALVYPYIVKGESFFTFNNVSAATYNAAVPGSVLTGSYPMTASLERELIPATALPSATPGSTDAYFTARKKMIALQNTMNFYRNLSNFYEYTGSYMTGDVNMISIPSIFYDAGIKKGSVSLKFYFSGSLMDEAKDEKQNGELISTMGLTSGSVVGVVLYNEGFLLLTSSAAISNDNYDTYTYNKAILLKPSWKYFGAYTGSATAHVPPSSSVYDISFRATNTVPVTTMFATVQPGELTNSQNPTWISSSAGDWRSKTRVTSGTYVELDTLPIKNTIQSQYCRFDQDFQKQTFISKIGIFDEEKNLIAVAKIANPVLKREEDSYTFKLKIDF